MSMSLMYKERLTIVDFLEDTGFLLKSLEKRTFLEFISMCRPNADRCEPSTAESNSKRSKCLGKPWSLKQAVLVAMVAPGAAPVWAFWLPNHPLRSCWSVEDDTGPFQILSMMRMMDSLHQFTVSDLVEARDHSSYSSKIQHNQHTNVTCSWHSRGGWQSDKGLHIFFPKFQPQGFT